LPAKLAVLAAALLESLAKLITGGGVELPLLSVGADWLCDRTGWRGDFLRVANCNPADKGQGQGHAPDHCAYQQHIKWFHL
jgi:hypothetical protein